MPRAIWSGSISFGLVNVPVKAFTAMRDHSVHFNQLEKGTGARIRYLKVSDKTGKEVPADEIEHGYEISKGSYVIVDPEELDALRPKMTRSIDISDFVALADIDPIYYERTYWLAPANDAAARAYRLLQQAMEEQGRVAIGTVVLRNKQYLTAIRPLDGALAMSTMRFADEVVDKADIDELPGRGKAEPKELKMAAQLIDSLTTDWDPERYSDTYTEQLRDLIEAKAAGKDVTVEDTTEAPSKVLDLMAALEASLGAAKSKRGQKDLPTALVEAAEELADEAENDGEEKGGTKKPAKKAAAKGSSGAKKAPARKKAATKKQPAGKSAQRKSA